MIFAAATDVATVSVHSSATMILDIGLMAMLVVVGLAIVRMRSLFAVVMLQGVYSLLCATWFVSLDAVDVAFTEAAVGAGISTVLMLGAMLLTDRQSSPITMRRAVGPFLIVVLAGAALLYAVPDMPDYGDKDSAVNTGVGMQYMETSPKDIDVPNVVTAVLASYRSYDTMGETVVIFMAGLGVLLLLGLNGNAGRWRAQVQGQDISTDYAPVAEVLKSPSDAPKVTPEEVKAEVEPPKRRGRPKGSTNKPKTEATKKTAASKKKIPHGKSQGRQ